MKLDIIVNLQRHGLAVMLRRRSMCGTTAAPVFRGGLTVANSLGIASAIHVAL